MTKTEAIIIGELVFKCGHDCETVGIPPLMSRKTLGILDGGRGEGVDRSWRRRGIKGVDKGAAQYPALLGDDVAMHTAMLQVEISRLGPNLQNILRQSYNFLTIMPMLRSTYDGRLIYKTSYEGCKAILK